MKQLIQLANLLKINNKDKEIRTLQLNFFESLDNQQKVKWGMYQSHADETALLNLKLRSTSNLALQEFEFLVDSLSEDQKSVLQQIKDTLNLRKIARIHKKFKESADSAQNPVVEPPVANPVVEPPVANPVVEPPVATEN